MIWVMTFHRTGAVEIWGRGTNRVIEECRRYGVDPPTFEEVSGGLIVTFRASIGPGPLGGPGRDQVVRPLLDAGLLELTIPGKPTSSRQRYRTTEAGARVLSE